MRIKNLFLGGLVAVAVASCGGSGGGDEGIQLVQPSLEVKGLASAGSVTVALNGGAAQKTISTDGTYNYDDRIDADETYSLRVVSTTGTGVSCLFSNASDSIASVKAGGKSPVLDCQGGSGGGGSVGSAAPVGNGPFRVVGWSNEQFVAEMASGNNEPTARLIQPITLLDESGDPLTGAGLNNFTFYDTGTEVFNGQEFQIDVEPMPANNINLKIALAVDVSSSFSQSQLNTVKDALKLFVANQEPGTQFGIFIFDSEVASLFTDGNGDPIYVADKTAVQNAIDGIITNPVARDSATDLYGAMATTGSSLFYGMYDEGTLGYMITITDGLHTANSDGPDSTSEGDGDGVEDRLVFGVGVGNAYSESDFRTALGDSEGAGDTLVKAPQVTDINSALNEIHTQVKKMMLGLHAIYYRSPRRGDGGDYEFEAEATPLNECAAITGPRDACAFIWGYDPASFQNVSVPTIVPSAVNPGPGQTVTYRVPSWGTCSSSPDYQWTLTVNQGSATSTEINGGRALEVNYGSTTPINVDVEVTDANLSGCTLVFTATGP